ncbi:nucleotidyltransferase domain-containing protein, partial [Pseudonocardia pini]|uniref:nucleotidyltransferase domain-containing protein n=1 Tax=Pseudonocardia pini TaxID=2758030 RepID=UPI001C68AA74
MTDLARMLAPRLAALPGVVAVTLGGSRAAGTQRPDSDWDLGLYYRGDFDARLLAGLGFPGHVAQRGEWGRIVDGGAWLSVDGTPVDVLLRDLDRIDAWYADARAGRFEIDAVEGHVVGLPTYTPIGEIALGVRLAGTLPAVDFPVELRRTAAYRWRWGSAFSLFHARRHAERGELTQAAGMAARAVLQTAHGVLAGRGEWTLNEKKLVRKAGLEAADPLVAGLGRDPVAGLA